MTDLRFVWDPRKSKSNTLKHQVTFAEAHAMAEDMGCLAVATGQRATPCDLNVAFRVGKYRIGIESYAGIGRFIKTGSCHTGYFRITVTFNLCKKPGKGEFAFTNDHIIGIFRYFTGTGRSVRATDDSNAR